MIGLHALALPVGRELLAVPRGAAREVVAAPALTVLPTAPACVRGLFDLRGEILPALDAGLLLGWERCVAPSHVAVLESVRGVAGIVTTGPSVAVDLPATLGPARLPATLGTAWVTGSRGTKVEANVIDVDALLALASIPLSVR